MSLDALVVLSAIFSLFIHLQFIGRLVSYQEAVGVDFHILYTWGILDGAFKSESNRILRSVLPIMLSWGRK